MKTIDDNAACTALEAACPGLHYVVILANPETREVLQVGNIPPDMQKLFLSHALKSMETTIPEEILIRTKYND